MRGGGQTLSSTPRESIAQQVVQDAEPLPGSLMGDTMQKVASLKTSLQTLSVDQRTKDDFLKTLNWIELNEVWYQCLPDAAIKIIEDVLLQLLELGYSLLSEAFLCLQILKMCNSFSRVIVIYYTEHGEMDQDRLKQLRDVIEAMKVSLEDQAETVLYHNGLQYEIEIVSGCLGMLLIEDKQGKALAMNLVKSIVISAVLMNPADDLFSSLADLAAFGVRTIIKKRKQKHLKEIITKCIFIEQLRWSIVMAVQQQPLRISALLGKIVGIYEKHVRPCKLWQVKYCWIKCMHQVMTHKIMITRYRIEKQNVINSIDLIDQWNELIGSKIIYTMFRHQDFVGIVNEISVKESSNQLSSIILREISNLNLIRAMIIEGTDQLPQLLQLAQLLTNQTTEMDTEAIFVQRKLQSLNLGTMAAHFNKITVQAQSIFDAYMNLQYDLELFQEVSQQKYISRNTQQIQLQLKQLAELIDAYCQSLIKSKIWTLYLKDVTVKIRALIPKDGSPKQHVLKHISFELNSLIKQSIKSDYPPYKQAWQAYLVKELQKIQETLSTIKPQQDRLIQILQSMIQNPSMISNLILQFNEIVQQITGRISLGSELSVQMQIQCDELSDLEFTLCDQVKAGWHITKILILEQLDFKSLTNIWNLHQLERFVGVANRQNIIKTQVVQIEDLLNILCQDSRIVHQIYTLNYDLSPTVEERLIHLREEVRLKWMLMTIRKQASNCLSELVLGQLQTQVIKLQGQEISRFNDHFVNLLHFLESTYNIASDSQQKEFSPPPASATSKFIASLPGYLDQIVFRLHSTAANLKNIQNKFSKELKIFQEQLQQLPRLDIRTNKYLDYVFSIYENSIDISPNQIISDCKLIITELNQFSIFEQENKVNLILDTINLFLSDQGLVQLTASIQLLGKKLKQTTIEISEEQINYINLKGQQLLDIDIGCIPNIIITGKQYIEILNNLCQQLESSEPITQLNQPLRQSKQQNSIYIQDLSAQRDSDLNDLYQVQRNLDQIIRYHDSFSVQYQRLQSEIVLISKVEKAQEVQIKIAKLGVLFQQNYQNFINELELVNDLRIESIIDKSLQVVEWDMSFLERIYTIAPENKLKQKVKQLIQSKQKKNSWRLKECELFYVMIMQSSLVNIQWKEQYGCRLVSAKVLETDLRIQKLLASRDFLTQTQNNLDQYWQQQSQSVQASIERQLLQLGLIQRQIKSQQNETKRQELIRQHKELEFEIDCQIENTKQVGDALGIAIAFLKDLKKQLSAIQDQLDALTQKIDEIGLDLKFLRGKTARQLMELRMVSVLQHKAIEDANSIYVPLMSKEWDFETEADMPIATPIFNTDNSDQGEVDEFIQNKLQTSLLIHGNAGCGKSTAARKIEEYLWLNYQSKPHSWNDINSPALLPIYIQLPMLKDPKFGAMQEALLGSNYRFDQRQMTELQEAVQKGYIRLIIIMDSYDELNQEFIGLNLNISNKLALWKSNNFLKVITTSRTEIFTRNEYRDWFVVEGKATQKYFKEIRIMPFDYEQRSEFLRQHCRLAVKQQVTDIYEILCDARKDLQKLIEDPWKEIERLLEFQDQQRLLTKNQIQSLIQILKRDPQISLYDEQEKHLKQQLSRLWPIVYFDRSIEQLGIQRLVESPYMTKIVVQVLPSLIMQFSQQEHVKPIFLRKYLGNHKNEVWEWLIDQKFFTLYQVTMQWGTIKKLFSNTPPEFITNTDLIIEALQANKPVSFDFYDKRREIFQSI